MVTSAEEAFPEASFAVKVTLLIPRFEQLKVNFDRVIEVMPTLSEEPSLTCSGETDILPVVPSATLISLTFTTGARMSFLSPVLLKSPWKVPQTGKPSVFWELTRAFGEVVFVLGLSYSEIKSPSSVPK